VPCLSLPLWPSLGLIAAVMRHSPPAILFALPLCSYAAALAVAGDSVAYVFSGMVLAAHVVVYLLPWRVPRDDRTPFGYWFEAVACTLPFGAGVTGWLLLASRDRGTDVWPSWPAVWWLPVWSVVAVAVGIVLIRCSGLDIRALRVGDLAFLAGSMPVYRAAARTWTVLVSVAAEEVLYRGVPDRLASKHWLLLCLGAVAFVSGHHMVRGAQNRLSKRAAANEAGAAVLLGALVVLSGSVWPAIAAHAIADLPYVVLDFQRARMGQAETGQIQEVA
jgi:hypothetical protein